MANDHPWKSRQEMLDLARDRAGDDPVTLTIRDLLVLWNAQARGAQVVQSIRRGLEQAGLVTDPDFASGYIDNHVRLVRAPSGPAAEPAAAQEVSLKVGHLRAAAQEVISVRPDQPLA